MPFGPIAVVGRACVLPGALHPSALWEAVAEGRDLVGPVPDGRWGVDAGDALCAPEAPSADRTPRTFPLSGLGAAPDFRIE